MRNIILSRIKRWGFKQRVFEIQKRLRLFKDGGGSGDDDLNKLVDEALEIVDYWMDHMEGDIIEKPVKKKKKEMNLW